MANGKIYNATTKKWETVEEIKAKVFGDIDAAVKRADGKQGMGIEPVSSKTAENAKSILGGLVDEIDAHNSKWIKPSVSKAK